MLLVVMSCVDGIDCFESFFLRSNIAMFVAPVSLEWDPLLDTGSVGVWDLVSVSSSEGGQDYVYTSMFQ